MDLYKIENSYWKKGVKHIAGIDEAGRGPLAGPVVAACVILNKNNPIKGLNDSKKISHKRRLLLYNIILENALDVSIGIAHEKEIDSINILNATMLAMRRAVGNLKVEPDQILVDGPHSSIKFYPVEHIVRGDSKSSSIAAGSIIAKVTRDNLMAQYDLIYPKYGFIKHKGYGTKLHIDTLKRIKATPIHRKSYRIVKENSPIYRDYLANTGINNLGHQVILSNYIKKDFKIKFINIELNDDIIDALLLKKNKLYFVKIITIYKSISYSNGNSDIKDYSNYKLLLEEYLNKKELSKKFIFNVISIAFILKKEPIIKTIYSEKNI